MSGPAVRRVLLGLSLIVPGLLHAQQVRAGGRLVRVTATDTITVPGTQVMLHRIGREQQGPLDSVVTDPQGRFQFRFRDDTAAVFIVSAGWSGIEYFSSPLHTNPALPDTAIVLVVSDTSSVAPVVTVSRHIVISKPTADGLRASLEIVAISNPGTATRIAPDTLRPSWTTVLPRNVQGFTAGSGDFSSEALAVRNDSVFVFAPIAPGEKQLVYTYAIAPDPGRVTMPVPDSIGSLTILLEETGITVRGGGMVPIDTQVIEGRTFRKWEAAVRGGSTITIDFPGNRTAWVIPALVGGIAAVLIVYAVLALRRRPVRVTVAAPSLVDQLARLDARYAGKEAATPPAEWTAYQQERARLKAELQVELARSETKA